MKKIIYILKHNFYVNREYIKRYGFSFKVLFHDIDKFKQLAFGKYSQEKHRNEQSHHLQWMIKNAKKVKIRDIREMFSDFESARFSKPTKQLNCKEFWKKVDKKDIPKSVLDIAKIEIKKF